MNKLCLTGRIEHIKLPAAGQRGSGLMRLRYGPQRTHKPEHSIQFCNIAIVRIPGHLIRKKRPDDWKVGDIVDVDARIQGVEDPDVDEMDVRNEFIATRIDTSWLFTESATPATQDTVLARRTVSESF